jgi:uncharacterized protein (TIGR03437 family)
VYRILATALLFAASAHAQRQLAGRLFGGSGYDEPSAIAADAQGNIYVAGTTTSADLPASGSYQPKPAVLPLSISSDGGATFNAITIPAVSEIVSLAATADGAVLYAGTPSSLMRSGDGGQTWSRTTPGIPARPQVLAISPRDPSVVYAGTAAGFYRSTDGGSHWDLIPSAMSQYQTAIFHQILADPLQPSTLWVVAGNTPEPSGIYTSNDGGDTWTAIPIPPFGGLSYGIAQSLALDPDHSGTVYAGGQVNPIYKSTDGGRNWQTLAFIFGTVVLDPSNPSILYVNTGVGIQKSIDGGQTFADTGLHSTAALTALAIDPGDPMRLYAASNQALFTSGDGGATWSATSIHSVAQIAVAPGRLLVGAQIPPQVYVAKFSPDLSQLVWATYLGGSGFHSVSNLAVDSVGNAYVAGATAASDFPITPGAFQTSGSTFVSKVSADGTRLLASTYFGTFPTNIAAVAVDASGEVYVAGSQNGGSLPTTPRSLQPAPPGPCRRPRDPGGFQPQNSGSGFIARISGDLSELIYSTYLTGTCGSSIFDIHVDPAGIATVVGGTYSLDFPIAGNAMIPIPPGSDESVFLTQIAADGGSLLYSTFLGGGPTTEAHAFLTDAAGNWYVTGGGSPASTPGAAQIKGSGSCPFAFGIGPPILQPPNRGEDAFITVFNARSTAPIFTATVGGSCLDEGDSIALDAAGNIWIAGLTQSPDLPLQSLVGGLGGQHGGFLAAFSPSGNALLTSGFAGIAPRLVAVAGRVAAAASTAHNPVFNGTYTYGTALATFDALSAPPVALDSIDAYSGAGTPGPIAPGQVVRLQGRGLGPPDAIAGTLIDGAVATSLGGVQVTFDGVPAPLLALQDGSAALVVPFEQQPFTTTVQVLRNGAPVSNPITWPIASRTGDLIAVSNADGTINSAQHPAAAGNTIGVFLTGLGAETPAVPDGRVATVLSAAPPVAIGSGIRIANVAVQPSYVGDAVGLVAGIVQINLPVPALGLQGPVLLQAPQFSTLVYVSR